jgi:predicted S18 family serine protease
MARRRARRREKSYLAGFLATSFLIGLLLGVVLVFTWLEGLPALQLVEGEVHTRSAVIVGVEKDTRVGRLATLEVGLRAGQGRLLIHVPPWENEDTQKSFFDAKRAAILETGRDLEWTDVIVSIENIPEPEETTIAGPSASAGMAVALVATIRASENIPPNEVRQDAVISAAIDSTGRLRPVGNIRVKYETVRKAGRFGLFVVASNQPGLPRGLPGLQIEQVPNLRELVELMLTNPGGAISSPHVEIQPA